MSQNLFNTFFLYALQLFGILAHFVQVYVAVLGVSAPPPPLNQQLLLTVQPA